MRKRHQSELPLPARRVLTDAWPDAPLVGPTGEPLPAGEPGYPPETTVPIPVEAWACPWHQRLRSLCQRFSWKPNVPLLQLALRTRQPFHGPPAKAYCQRWEALLGLPISEF